ncbi:hypothetical protein D3C76_1383570 [compost metagenome]
MAEGEAHGVRRRRLDRLDQAAQLQRLGMRVAARRGLVPGMGGVEHALEAEQHIVGVQCAAWLEVGGGVEFHIIAQGEVVDQAVGRYRPAGRQARHHLALRRVELHQAVHQHVSCGVGGGQRVVLHHVEAFGAGLAADAQRGGLGNAGGEQGACGEQGVEQ